MQYRLTAVRQRSCEAVIAIERVSDAVLKKNLEKVSLHLDHIEASARQAEERARLKGNHRKIMIGAGVLIAVLLAGILWLALRT